jgi:hypothetical protein
MSEAHVVSPISTRETIPDMSSIIKDTKTQKKLFSGLKSAIEFYSSMYSSNHMELDDKIKTMLSTGYIFLFKIMSALELLIIRKENQSNKILFEEAMQNLIPIPVYIGSLHDIIKNANTIEAGSIFDIVKVKSKLEERDSMLEQFTKQSEKIIEDGLYIKNNCLNNHVNLTLLSIIKTNEVLKKD